MNYRVNIGCGRTPTEGWVNFDNTPAIKLAKSPLKRNLAKLFRLLNQPQIENIEWLMANTIEFADAQKKIPLPEKSIEVLYTSHMFEHLSRDGAIRFLDEAKRVLVDGGVIRIVIPDLEKAISEYNERKNADEFMETLLLSAPPINSLRDKLWLIFSGYRHHQWMYDGNSLSRLMENRGFRNVTIQRSGETLINNPGNLNLFEREEESVVVEAMR
jgi:predicted SAM-dependent methyltransferase